jgi:hypothetical protein
MHLLYGSLDALVDAALGAGRPGREPASRRP